MSGAPGSFTDIAFDAGVIAERERIVKLLEDGIDFIPFEGLFFADSKVTVTKEDLLDLIRGEQK